MAPADRDKPQRPDEVEDEEPLVRIAARRAVTKLRRDAATPEFGRLLWFWASGVGGDALIGLALAGSLFFTVPEAEARGRVALYLLVTMAPFALIAPLLARLLDRSAGTLRLAMVVSSAGRVTLAWLLATRLDNMVWLLPLSFGILVLSRTGLIVRGAVLPQLVPPGRSLVQANASLSRIGALSGLILAPIGVALLRWPGPGTELTLAAIVYGVGVVAAITLPSPKRSKRKLQDKKGARAVLRSPYMRQAVLAASGLRFLLGYLIFHLAFALRREEDTAFGLALLVGSAALGTLLGALIAPRLRRILKEEGILVAALILGGLAALFVGLYFSLISAAWLVGAFSLTAGAAKTSFDAIIQRDSPPEARGWAFARFESTLQVAWVCGAVVPLVFPIPAGPGVVALGIAANVLAILVVVGRHRMRSRELKAYDS